MFYLCVIFFFFGDARWFKVVDLLHWESGALFMLLRQPMLSIDAAVCLETCLNFTLAVLKPEGGARLQG